MLEVPCPSPETHRARAPQPGVPNSAFFTCCARDGLKCHLATLMVQFRLVQIPYKIALCLLSFSPLAVFCVFLFYFPLSVGILAITDFTSPKEHSSFYFHAEHALVRSYFYEGPT